MSRCLIKYSGARKHHPSHPNAPFRPEVRDPALFFWFFRVSCGSAGENRHSHDGKRHASSGFPGKGRAEVESATVEEDRSAKVIAVAEAEGTVLDRLDPVVQ